MPNVNNCCLDCAYGFDHADNKYTKKTDTVCICKWAKKHIKKCPVRIMQAMLNIPPLEITRHHFIVDCPGYVAGNSIPQVAYRRKGDSTGC